MPKGNNRPNINNFNSSNHIIKRRRPPPTPTNPPILNVPNRKPLSNKHFSQRPPKFKPVPLMPKPAMDDDYSATRRPVGKIELTKLTGMLTVSNNLHR